MYLEYLWAATINQLRSDLRGDKRLFPADGSKKMELFKLILATFRKEISNETSEEIVNKLMSLLVEIIQKTEPLFYRRQLIEIIYECELLFERFITLELKKGITSHRKLAVFNKLRLIFKFLYRLYNIDNVIFIICNLLCSIKYDYFKIGLKFYD